MSTRLARTERLPQAAGARGASTQKAGVPLATKGLLAALAVLFLCSLSLPNVIFLGGIRLTPYRFLLLVGFVPIMLAWMQGQGGEKRSFDYCMILSILWSMLALIVIHGFDRGGEAAIILMIEGMGAFFLARVAIRNTTDFTKMLKLHLLILLVLFPFSIFETMTGRPLIVEIAQKIGPAVSIISDPSRMGLERVQGPFEHSILYGAFCASAFGGAYYVLKSGLFSKIVTVPIIVASTVISVSSAALLAVVFQFVLIIYDHATRTIHRRWTIFGWGMAALYVLIDMLSNRNPFHVVVSYLTFNTGSAYNRILIWRYGTDNVAKNPLFGLGFNDWERPHWMGASVDNFWLLLAMRHGLPTIIFLIAATFLILRKISWADLRSPLPRNCRAAYLTVMGGMILASATVHYWNAMYVWFIFLIGSGSFLLDIQETGDAKEETSSKRSKPNRSSKTEAPLPDAPEIDTAAQPTSRYTRGNLKTK